MNVLLLVLGLVGADAEEQAPRVETAGLSHLMRGLHFMSQGHASAAVPHLRLALLYDPGSPFIHAKLSEAWLRAGDPEKARAIVQAGLNQTPGDPELNLRAGLFATRAERFATALRPLTTAARNPDTRGRAAPPLVDALLWIGRRDRARTEAARAAQRDPSNVALLHALGAAFEDHDQLERALAYYSKARAQRPSNRAAALSEIRVLDLLGRASEAADALIQLFAHYPNEPQLFMWVHRYLRAAEREEADAYLREAKRLAGREAGAALVIARGLAVEGALDEAIEYLQALDLDREEARIYLAELELLRERPKGCVERLRGVEDPRALRRLARCQAQLGRTERAMKAVRSMLELGAPLAMVAAEAAWVSTWSSNVGTARVRFRGFVQELEAPLGQRELELAEAQISDHYGLGRDALVRLEGLDRNYPNDVEIDLRLADLQCRYGDLEEGLKIFEELVDRAPANAARLNALGFTLADVGRELDRAEVLIRRAYRLSFDEGYITDSLGWLHYRRGELESALRFVERALALDGPESVLLLHLGDVQRALGLEERARASYARALRYNPTAETQALVEERLRMNKGGLAPVRSSKRRNQ